LGPTALSDTELFSPCSCAAAREMNVLCARLAPDRRAPARLAGLIAWAETDYRRLRGIGHVKALQLMTVMEIARRVLGERQGECSVG